MKNLILFATLLFSTSSIWSQTENDSIKLWTGIGIASSSIQYENNSYFGSAAEFNFSYLINRKPLMLKYSSSEFSRRSFIDLGFNYSTTLNVTTIQLDYALISIKLNRKLKAQLSNGLAYKRLQINEYIVTGQRRIEGNAYPLPNTVNTYTKKKINRSLLSIPLRIQINWRLFKNLEVCLSNEIYTPLNSNIIENKSSLTFNIVIL